MYYRRRLLKLPACLRVNMWQLPWWTSWWIIMSDRFPWGRCNSSTLTWSSVNVSQLCLGKNEYLYTCTFNRFADRILKPLLRKMCVLILLLSCPWGYKLDMKIFNQHIDFFLYWVWSLKKKVHVDPAWKISSHLPTQMTFLINSLEIKFLHNVYRIKKKL